MARDGLVDRFAIIRPAAARLAILPSTCSSNAGTSPASSPALLVSVEATILLVPACAALRQDRSDRPCFCASHTPCRDSFNPLLSITKCIEPFDTARCLRPATPRLPRLNVAWSGTRNSCPSNHSTPMAKPSAWGKAKRKTSRRIGTTSIFASECQAWPPGAVAGLRNGVAAGGRGAQSARWKV